MMFSTGDCSEKPLLTGSGEPMGHADGSSASLPCAQPSEARQATSPALGVGCWLKLHAVVWSRNRKLMHRHREDRQKGHVSSGLL